MPKLERHSLAASIQMPPTLRQWLFQQGSLTRKIELRFRAPLKIISCVQDHTRANALEKHLGLQQNLWPQIKQGWCREVVLGCGTEAQVFARVFIPRSANNKLIRLKSNHHQPLGRWLYKAQKPQRQVLYVNALYQTLKKYPELSAWHPQRLEPLINHAPSYIRCSKFQYQTTQLLLTEVYLPNLVEHLNNA